MRSHFEPLPGRKRLARTILRKQSTGESRICHTYITLTSRIAGLRTRFKLGQEGKTKVLVTFKTGRKTRNRIRFLSLSLTLTLTVTLTLTLTCTKPGILGHAYSYHEDRCHRGLASPVYVTLTQNTLAILEPQSKIAEGFWHPAVHPLGN